MSEDKDDYLGDDSDEYSVDSTVNDEKLAIALKIFKQELVSEIEEATRQIANEVAGETKEEMNVVINDLMVNVIPKLTSEMSEAKVLAEKAS